MTSIHLKVVALAVTGALVVGGATADGHATTGGTSLYGFAVGGTSLNSNLDYSGIIGGNPNTVDVELDSGFQFGLGIGKKIDKWSTSKVGVRGELELSFSNNGADGIAFSGNGPAAENGVSGGIQTGAIFANVLADFKTGSAFTPYVGGGVGIGRVSQDLFYLPEINVSDSDTVLAAQLIAGVAYAATDTIILTADVRHREFFNVSSTRLNPAGANTGNISGNYGTTSVNVGLRFSF
jgi:opacity protein-like surface antigen